MPSIRHLHENKVGISPQANQAISPEVSSAAFRPNIQAQSRQIAKHLIPLPSSKANPRKTSKASSFCFPSSLNTDLHDPTVS
jgi:hypothetical protein